MALADRIASLATTIDLLLRARSVLKGVDDYKNGLIGAHLDGVPDASIVLNQNQIQDSKQQAEDLITQARAELAKV